MINIADVQSMIAKGESERLELKKSTGELRGGMQSLCAMLNHRGGTVVFGVEPSGSLLGQNVSGRTLEDISQEVREIDPSVFPQVERCDAGNGREVILVVVTTGQNRPYSYRGQAYKRVGNTTVKLSRDEYNRTLIERFHGERRWETEPAEGWSVDDLDLKELTKTIDEAIRRGRISDPGTRDPIELLRGLGLLRANQILRAAVVLFGKRLRVETEFPQCLLRVAKFKGTDKTEFLDSHQFHGNAFRLINRADSYLRENLPIAGRVLPEIFERKDDPLYPPVALREALANGFCHRDYSIGGGSVAVAIYSDRLEITSSGTLHFGLTPEKLYEPHDSLPWNPIIARVFHRRGIIESWGRGTLKIAELTEDAGLPRPQIDETAGCVVVRFRSQHYTPPSRVTADLTARQQAVLAVLSKLPGGAARSEIVAELKEPGLSVRNDLHRLRDLKLVVSSGYGRGAVWRLAAASRKAERH